MSKLNYPKHFRAHINDFIDSNALFNHADELLVLVSGGLDSMGLLHILTIIHPKHKLTVLHINHGTREGQKIEESLVRKFCSQLDVKCIVETLQSLDANIGNFELLARNARKKIVDQLNLTNAKVISAHHIDDSYEWYLLSQFKSATSDTLGIPVVNGVYRRPLLCVTKQQLKKYCLLENVPYSVDPTNDDVRFERNFIRAHVIATISERYPAYLKNYVNRVLRIAAQQNLLYRKKNIEITIVEHEHGTLIYHEKLKDHYHSYEPELLKAIYRLSHQERGTVRDQLNKVRKALQSCKPGPLLFSGGVAVYTDRCLLLVCRMSRSQPSLMQALSGNLDDLLPILLNLITGQREVVLPCIELDRKALKRIGIKMKASKQAKKRLTLGQFLNRWSKSPRRHLSFSVYY